MTDRNRLALSGMLTFMFVAPMALAETPPAPAPSVADGKSDKKVVDPRINDQTIVCKREDSTGTRLGATRVCHTRAQWAAQSEYSRRNTQILQDSVTYH